MPIVYEEQVRKDISARRFSPIYLIFGDDSYLKNYYKDSLAKKASDGDPFFNLQKFEGDIDLQEVFDAVNQFPMMAERKSVVLSDFDFEHCSKTDFDRLLEIISNANDTTVLIICFDSIEFDAKKGAKEKKIISDVLISKLTSIFCIFEDNSCSSSLSANILHLDFIRSNSFV